MSLRWRKTLTSAARVLVAYVALLTVWHWQRHASWGAMAPWAVGMLVLTAGSVTYTWWWYGDPRHQAAAVALRQQREERRRLR